MADGESTVQSTAQIVGQLAKDVPIYSDLVQPTAKALGNGLGGALAWLMQPLAMLGIRAEINQAKFKEEYAQKLSQIPEADLIHPNPAIVGPALQALAFTAQEDSLRSMFVLLLASASNSKKKDKAHPSFVDIIKQLSPQDAGVLKRLSYVNHFPIINIQYASDDIQTPLSVIKESDEHNLDSHQIVIDNLSRLRLITYVSLNSPEYSTAEAKQILSKVKNRYEDTREYIGINKVPQNPLHKWARFNWSTIQPTSFGRNFLETCVMDDELTPP